MEQHEKETIALFLKGQRIRFSYSNWRGESAERDVEVVSLVFGHSEWHPDPQWLLEAYDHDRRAVRLFALRDMSPLPANSKVLDRPG
jgi:predicted DNA-binding transcriptional regulator YafY